MRKLTRPVCPVKHATDAKDAADVHCQDYDKTPAAYQSGLKKFKFKALYKKAGPALERAQHGKCCYCESRYAESSFARVDHYRPKGRIRTSTVDLLPGYYWLAYSWDNLVVSCELCNNAKSDFFPICSEAARARSHHDLTSSEHPLLINPYDADPALHIDFYRDAIRAWDEVGKTTIEMLKLDTRHDLVNGRLERYSLVSALLQVAAVLHAAGKPIPPESKDILQQQLDPNRPYAAPILKLLTQHLHLTT